MRWYRPEDPLPVTRVRWPLNDIPSYSKLIGIEDSINKALYSS